MATVEQVVTVTLDEGQLRSEAAKLEGIIDDLGGDVKITGDASQFVREVQLAQRRKASLGEDITTKIKLLDEELEQGVKSKKELEGDITTKLNLVGEEELEQALKIGEELDRLVAEVEIDADPVKLEQAFDLAERLQNFTALVTIDAEREGLEEALDLGNKIDRLNPIVNILARDESLKQALSLAEDLERDRQIKLFVDDSDADRSAKKLNSLDIKPVKLNIDDSDLKRIENTELEIPVAITGVSEALSNIDGGSIGAGLGGSIGSGLTSALSAAGPQGAAVAAAGTALAAVFGVAFSESVNFEQANDRLAAQLDLNTAEAERAGRIAAEVYGGAWGESLEEVNNALRGVIGTMGDLDSVSESQFAALTATALDLSVVLDQDVNEVLRATQAILSNELAGSAEEAFDVIAKGAAEGGLRADDLLETFAEYSNQFADIGVSAEQFTSLMIEGLDAGARSSDGVADSIKELYLGISEGSKPATTSVRELGLDYQQLLDLFNSGQGFEAIQLISQALGEVESQSEQARIAQALLGGTYEQTGLQAVLGLGKATGAVEDLDGAAVRAGETLNDNLGVKLEELQRRAQLGFVELGDAAIEFAEALDFGDATAELSEFGTEVERAAVLLEPLAAVLASISVDVLESSFAAGTEALRALNFLTAEATEDFTRMSESVENTAEFLGVFDSDPVITLAENAALADEKFRAVGKGILEVDAAVADTKFFQQGAELISGIGDAADGASAEVRSFGEEIQSLLLGIESGFDFSSDELFRSSFEAVEELANSLTGAGEAQINFRGEIDQSTEAGRNLATALESANQELQNQAIGYANGSLTIDQFGDAQSRFVETLKDVGAEAGLGADEIDRLVKRYLTISDQKLQELKINIDGEALEVFRAQLDLLPDEQRVALGFDFKEGSSAEDVAFRAQQAFAGLDVSIPIVYDINNDGLISATESLAGFRNLQALAKIGFDFDGSGKATAQEAGDAFALVDFYAELGFDVNLNGKTTADELAAAFDLVTATADLGYTLDESGVVRALEQGESFDLENYLAELGYEINESGRLTAISEGQAYAGTTFESTLASNSGPALGTLNSAEQAFGRFSRDTYTTTVEARDNASGVIDRIKGKTVFIDVVTRTRSIVGFSGTGRILEADGGIIDSGGVERMHNGGILDGIAPAQPGGVRGIFNGRNVLMAENGGDELFLNSRSRLDRQIDLIENFANGRLDNDLRQHYTSQQPAGETTINVYATTPVADPVLAGSEIARQVAEQMQQEKSRERAMSSSWSPR